MGPFTCSKTCKVYFSINYFRFIVSDIPVRPLLIYLKHINPYILGELDFALRYRGAGAMTIQGVDNQDEYANTLSDIVISR